MWDAADIWMDCNRHHAGALRTFGIKRLELILGAAKKLLCVMMLKDHHRDIVQRNVLKFFIKLSQCRRDANFCVLYFRTPLGSAVALIRSTENPSISLWKIIRGLSKQVRDR